MSLNNAKFIVVKVDLQLYCTFEDVCKLAIKVEKHSKNKRPFTSSSSRPSSQTKSYSAPKAEALLKEDKGKEKGKGILKMLCEKLDGKGCFKY